MDGEIDADAEAGARDQSGEDQRSLGGGTGRARHHASNQGRGEPQADRSGEARFRQIHAADAAAAQWRKEGTERGAAGLVNPQRVVERDPHEGEGEDAVHRRPPAHPGGEQSRRGDGADRIFQPLAEPSFFRKTELPRQLQPLETGITISEIEPDEDSRERQQHEQRPEECARTGEREKLVPDRGRDRREPAPDHAPVLHGSGKDRVNAERARCTPD